VENGRCGDQPVACEDAGQKGAAGPRQRALDRLDDGGLGPLIARGVLHLRGEGDVLGRRQVVCVPELLA
jgi:hypothetical protein